MLGASKKTGLVSGVWAAPPMFEYEANTIHTGVNDDLCRLDDFLNAKASQGWRVHTCQRVGEGSYFVVLDKLKIE